MYPLNNSSSLGPLLHDIGERPVVMLGEASHGTHEYYTWRSAITKRLIREKGFRFIAVEGDWPDCYRLNRYVKGYINGGADISAVLGHFDRWPTWMWANWEVAALAEWLKEYNADLSPGEKVGFYGLDVYSLWDSLRAMIEYLDVHDKEAALYVKNAVTCFEPYNEDEQQYARFSLSEHNCRDEVIDLLKQIRLRTPFYDGDSEAGFNTEQNALITVNAERYYRSMMEFNESSWNIRDRHMMETLERLISFHGNNSKAIVWEHNTHIGDARATDMVIRGTVNTGQLAREKYGEENVYLAGFSSYAGSVIAAESWGAPLREFDMPEAREKSIEAILHHELKTDGFILLGEEPWRSRVALTGHRAIGVVYDPKREQHGNYVPSVLPRRYDALLYIDKTSALHPMQNKADGHKMPETYPFGL